MALSQRSRTVLTLYSSNDDAQCHRVRLVLAAKGVVYDLVPVTAKNPPEDLLDLNPYNSVPTLVDRDLVLYDTGVICEYLDERYPHPPLMPVDPLSRARLRLATVRIERDWLPFVAQIHAGGRPAETARKRLREALLAAVPLFKAA
ncbi:MAG: glutathione S-transferase N-terminal domain-containing protein, partial [Deltaproteobacteria bacterium]